MIRFHLRAVLMCLGVSAGFVAVGQSPADPHSATPPLADPLKQQAVTDLPPTLATPAVQFIMQASMEGLTEVRMAKVALARATAPGVRQFAQHMVADHERMNAKLEFLAMTKGTSVPEVLDIDHANNVEKISTLSGLSFDTAYVTQTVSAHDRALASYGAASSFSDTEVAAFARAMRPVLLAHKSAAEALEKVLRRRAH